MVNVFITSEPLSLDAAYKQVLRTECGGNCIFIGTTRSKNKREEVTHLDFETYRPMALKEMSKIGKEAISKFNVLNVSIHHREGRVGHMEIAVIIAVSSIHRKEAFEACKYAIDTLKERVPIWKKEYLESGEVWVNAHP